mmetsp:Transcript_7776/g.27610  ORF Transcript_7776/g.27610 Transcript_7776/m.27610 type:complete len:227 (-) Transcript_7776:2054-2734(-)
MIVTLSSGSACSRNQPAMAWPASWNATVFFSFAVISALRFSRPPITRSVASSKSESEILLFFLRAAMMAASLQMFAISAPANPGVSAASRSAYFSGGPASVRFFMCTWKISARPLMSGSPTVICRSKRPGRRIALSRMSARLVPASTMTPSVVEKPSISTSSWFSVFSRSSLPPLNPPLPRARATASISSMKTMQGALARACAKRSRTRLGPTPTNISIKSEPDME